jgi:hypothetical protein
MSFPGAVASKVELDQAQNLRGVSRGILENSPHLPDDKCAIEVPTFTDGHADRSPRIAAY